MKQIHLIKSFFIASILILLSVVLVLAMQHSTEKRSKAALESGIDCAETCKSYQQNTAPYTSCITTCKRAIAKSNKIDKIQVGVLYGGLDSSEHKKRNETEQILAFPQWKDRWPYFTIIRSENSIDIHQDDQRVIDQEIQLASSAGLDFWTFEGYPGSYANSSNFGLNKYLKSEYKNQLKFNLLISANRFSDPDWKTKYLAILIPYFKDTQYVRVKNMQPLFYLFTFDRIVTDLGAVGAKNRMSELRSAIKNELGVEPYMVILDNGSQDSYNNAKYFGFDARSSYLGRAGGAAFSSQGSPYNTLATAQMNYWNTFVGSDLDLIPTVSTGLDPRPKIINDSLHDWGANPPWFQKATGKEIAENLSKTMSWVVNNPKNSSALVVSIAHWSSISEGQWLVPTIGEDNTRLNEISKVLGGSITKTPESPYIADPPSAHPVGSIVIDKPITDNVKIKANVPVKITGTAPFAARVSVVLGNSKFFFVNVKGGLGGTIDAFKFSIDVPAVPVGGPYQLKFSSPDIQTLIIKNIQAK